MQLLKWFVEMVKKSFANLWVVEQITFYISQSLYKMDL